MFSKFTSRLKFLLKSTNEHGVHSPFVFNYVTKCLYSKKRMDRDKCSNVLLKSIAYFNYQNIHIDNNMEVEKLAKDNFPHVQFNEKLYDILFFEQLTASDFKKVLFDGKLHNDSMILVNAIHGNKTKLEEWNQLISIPQITVSIDMYYCGAIFIRREQVKEHFTIRI